MCTQDVSGSSVNKRQQLLWAAAGIPHPTKEIGRQPRGRARGKVRCRDLHEPHGADVKKYEIKEISRLISTSHDLSTR